MLTGLRHTDSNLAQSADSDTCKRLHHDIARRGTLCPVSGRPTPVPSVRCGAAITHIMGRAYGGLHISHSQQTRTSSNTWCWLLSIRTGRPPISSHRRAKLGHHKESKYCQRELLVHLSG
jgi:hypothetical protein